MGALEALITPDVVEEVVAEVEVEVAITCKAGPEAVSTSSGGARAEYETLARVPEVVKVKDIERS